MKSLHLFSVERIENAWIVTFREGYSATTKSFTKWSELTKDLENYAFYDDYCGTTKTRRERGP